MLENTRSSFPQKLQFMIFMAVISNMTLGT